MVNGYCCLMLYVVEINAGLVCWCTGGWKDLWIWKSGSQTVSMSLKPSLPSYFSQLYGLLDAEVA